MITPRFYYVYHDVVTKTNQSESREHAPVDMDWPILMLHSVFIHQTLVVQVLQVGAGFVGHN